jgi:hypothetical protein
MIDVVERDRLDRNLAEAFRKFVLAQVNLHKAKADIAELALKNEPIPEALRETITDAELDIDYWPQRLQEIKDEYIQLIREIKLPVIY